MMVGPERSSVVTGCSAVLAHTPGLVRHGSKPSRELPRDPGIERAVLDNLRTFEAAVAYVPHQTFIGGLHPRDMPQRPWTEGMAGAQRFAGAGEIMPEDEFMGLLAACDEFELVQLEEEMAADTLARLASHPLAKRLPLDRLESMREQAGAPRDGGLTLHVDRDRLAGRIFAGHESDESLSAAVLLENLACKATGVLALARLLHDCDVDPNSIDYVLSCAEEAVGDRYQRGGGNMGKTIAAAAGLGNASGADVKNFCAAPIPALVIAAALVRSGVFNRVAVVAGGSLPKLGMKFQGHLRKGLPVLEDVIGGMALLVQADDGYSPRVVLDSVGRHPVKAGASNPQIMTALAVEPIERLGLHMTDVDDYATELHNPDITEPQGSGNVPDRNYRTIAALAVANGHIERDEMTSFVSERGMPGFAPTQGHLASALCYVPHALQRLTEGDATRVQLIAKGSLFLGRMSQLSDGMSVMLERNDG
jgi:glycine/sarcosine/betaine reductase complex component C subunit beta